MKDNEQALLERVPDGLFIGGQWVAGSAESPLDVHDPSTGDVIKSIANATAELLQFCFQYFVVGTFGNVG